MALDSRIYDRQARDFLKRERRKMWQTQRESSSNRDRGNGRAATIETGIRSIGRAATIEKVAERWYSWSHRVKNYVQYIESQPQSSLVGSFHEPIEALKLYLMYTLRAVHWTVYVHSIKQSMPHNIHGKPIYIIKNEINTYSKSPPPKFVYPSCP